jgi:hypothetical protein
MAFYPKAQEIVAAEPALDYATEAPEIIALLETGCPSNYKVDGTRTGDPLPKEHICALRLAGRDAPQAMSAIYDQVLAERDKLAAAALKVTDKTTQTEYVAELDKVAVAASSATWLASMKTAYKVSTWSDLRAKIAVAEVVAVEAGEEEIKP